MTIDAFCDQLQSEKRKLVKEQKTNDIIQFMKVHWYLWTGNRIKFQQALEDVRGDLSVESLSSQLGLPPEMYFKRITKQELVKMLVDFQKSPIFEVFLKCVHQQRSASACLFLVSGKSNYVVTNMHVEQIPGKMQLHLKSKQNAKDIYIFPVQEAAERMSIFNHEGEE